MYNFAQREIAHPQGYLVLVNPRLAQADPCRVSILFDQIIYPSSLCAHEFRLTLMGKHATEELFNMLEFC